MDRAPAVLSVNQIANQGIARPRPIPRLHLLIDWEPRGRVFVQNLGDLVLRRKLAPVVVTSRPGKFWTDVFTPSGLPWSGFLESLLLQLLLVLLLIWGQSRVWDSVKLLPQPSAHQTVTYYPPKDFRATDSRAPNPKGTARPKQAARHQAATPVRHQTPMAVTAERKASLVAPPDIRQTAVRPPNLAGSSAITPAVPLPAATGSRKTPMPGMPGVVAPEAQINQATGRKLGLPQTSAVAPAPQIAASSTGRGATTAVSGPAVIPPQPSLQAAGTSGRSSSLSSSTPGVVPPAPSVQGAKAGGRLGVAMGPGAQVVPPAPSVAGAPNSDRIRRPSSLAGNRPSVVPPPPSVQGSGSGPGNSRLGSMNNASAGIVPPPPSVGEGGKDGRSARLNSMGGGPGVIPPPPSVGASGEGGRSTSLAGSGSQAVPPPPSVEANAGGNGRGGERGSLDGPAVERPLSAGGAVNSGGTGLLQPMDPLPTGDDAGASQAAANEDGRPTEELALGLLGVVFAPQGTSFFSNFEVFVAKRRVNGELRLIKLVYEFLPYQRRLSEYDLSNTPARVIKLKVTPDPACNESLEQMIQPKADANGQTGEAPKLPDAIRKYDLSSILPCYRTTAADFQKAMAHAR